MNLELDKSPKNNQGRPHGWWERYGHGDNKLWYKGLFHNGDEVGYWSEPLMNRNIFYIK